MQGKMLDKIRPALYISSHLFGENSVNAFFFTAARPFPAETDPAFWSGFYFGFTAARGMGGSAVNG
jgi:hypothetical protein